MGAEKESYAKVFDGEWWPAGEFFANFQTSPYLYIKHNLYVKGVRYENGWVVLSTQFSNGKTYIRRLPESMRVRVAVDDSFAWHLICESKMELPNNKEPTTTK